MRILMLAAVAAIPSVSAASGPPHVQAPVGPSVCRPATPPAAPNTEDGNPGFGGTTGLNGDFHDEFADPLDHPGQVIGPFNRDLAQSGVPGGNHVLQDFVGNDCPKG